MTVTLSQLHHVGIVVSDMERASAFYTRLFGAEPSFRTEIRDNPGFARMVEAENAHAHIAVYDLGGMAVELLAFVTPPPVVGRGKDRAVVAGSKHLCFQVDDFDRVHEAMIAEGYQFTAAPKSMGRERCCACRR